MSLLARVEEYWKKNLPKAYKRMKKGELKKMVADAEKQIALMYKQGAPPTGPEELVYPTLFPEPEDGDDAPRDRDGAYI